MQKQLVMYISSLPMGYACAFGISIYGHKLWVGTEPVLKDLALLDGNGKTHESVCDVLLSAITGDGLDMELGSPYRPKAKL